MVSRSFRLRATLAAASTTLAVVGAIAPASAQTADIAPPAVEQPASLFLSRSIKLPEIGLADGARLSGLGSSRDFYFPVPKSMKYAATLALSYESATSFDSQRSIEVLVGERSLLLKPLTGTHDRQTLRIALDSSDAVNGFVKISVRYGRVLPDDRCVDIRFAGDHLTVLPETSLQLTFDRAAVDSVASAMMLMPRDVAIYLPGRELNSREFGAALEAARAIRDTGRQAHFESMPGADLTASTGQKNVRTAMSNLAFTPRLSGAFTNALSTGTAVDGAQPWMQGAIVIASPEDVDALVANTRGALFRADAKPQNAMSSSLSMINFGNGPAILVSGADPQSAARLLASSWTTAAVKPMVTTDGSPLQVRAEGPYTLDRLPADLGARDVVDRAQWTVAIAAKDMPARRSLSALRLNVAVAPDESNSNAVVTAFFNETMMESVSTRTDMRAQLAFNIPTGLAGLNNSLRLVVQRQPQSGDCSILPVGFPAQLLGSSEIITNESPEVLRDFFEAASQFRDGVTYYVEQRSAFAQRANLAALTELSANLVPSGAPASVRFVEAGQSPQTSGPFISLTSKPPENSEPPVRFDQGRAIIRGPDGKTIADLGGLKNTAVAQLIRAGLDQGLWIRTAADSEDLAPTSKLQLDRGNVAVLDKNGVAFAFSTERDRLVQVIYPDRTSLVDIANAYRPWVVGGLWLAFSLLVILSVQRFYARGRKRRPA